MKKTLLLFAALLFFVHTYAQQSNCQTPVADFQFQRLLKEIAASTTETDRLARAKRLADANCLSALQVKEVASKFHADQERLEFAKLAYPKTVDKENFYDVYDAFAYFSNAFRLHDFVNAQQSPANPTTPQLPNPTPNVQFANYNYPDAWAYRGATGCQQPINDQEMVRQFVYLQKLADDNVRMVEAKKFADAQCWTSAQAMKIVQAFIDERAKLDFLKMSANSIYDRTNYYFADQTLTDFRARQDFRQFLDNQGRQAQQPGACAVNSTDFEQFRRQIERENFNNTKLNMAKQILRDNGPCFSVDQLITLTKLFSFEQTRVEFAKFAYDFTFETNNYTRMVDAFNFSTSKDELLEFLKTK